MTDRNGSDAPRPGGSSVALWLDCGFVALGIAAFSLLVGQATLRDGGQVAEFGGPGDDGVDGPTTFPLASEEAVRALGGRIVLVSMLPTGYLLRADGTRAIEGDQVSTGVVLVSITLSKLVLEGDDRTLNIVVD